MRYFVFAVMIFFCKGLHSWNLQSEELRRRCTQEMPEWMKVQIAQDLSPFALKRSINNIGYNLIGFKDMPGASSLQLIHVKIHEGKIDVHPLFNLEQRSIKRADLFLKALRHLQEIISLPNLELIASMADSFDRPYFCSTVDIPIFTISKARHNACGILFPSVLFDPNREEIYQEVCEATTSISWENKKEIAFFRGSMSEGEYLMYEWDFKPRPRLIFQSRNHPERIDALFVKNDRAPRISLTWLNWLEMNGFFSPYIPEKEQVSYRYLIAIDGYGCPASLDWQLFSLSAVLKQDSKKIAWYYGGLKPFVHYIPFHSDSVDLAEKVVWLKSNDELAQEIANNARAFAEERLTDMMAFLYTYQLLVCYAQLQK